MAKNTFTTEQLAKLVGVEIPNECEVEFVITEPDEELSDAELAQISGGKMSFRGEKNISRIKIGFRQGVSSYLKNFTLNGTWDTQNS